MTSAAWTIAIDRGDIRQASITPLGPRIVADGQIEVAVDLYAMTANNVTYAVFGQPNGLFGPDAGYWDFFADRDEPGCLPVWGFGTVVQSRCDGISAGDQYYGYYPMASHVVLTPQRVSATGFIDGTPRRAALPVIYNSYQKLDALGDYRAADHDYWPVFRPLFLTGWLIADQFEDDGDYGVEQVLVASASSKTAICLGFSMQQRTGPRPRTVGLTSTANVAALSALGIYDSVISYDDVTSLDPATPSALVDIAGNGDVTTAVHEHFGDTLKASIIVGKSHWSASGGVATLPGPVRQGFFAPGRSQKRLGDWGGAGLAARLANAWLGFIDRAPSLATIDRRAGAEAALAAYSEVLEGRADPTTGIIVAP